MTKIGFKSKTQGLLLKAVIAVKKNSIAIPCLNKYRFYC